MSEEYPNLTVDQINTTTQFFQKLNPQGNTVTIRQIINACVDFSNQFKPVADLPWLTSLQNNNDLLDTSEITQTLYDEYKIKFPEMDNSFSDITAGEIITFLQLKTYFLNKEQSRLDAQYVPSYASENFISLIKTEKSLTDESSITLGQMLSYENEFNITRYWPL